MKYPFKLLTLLCLFTTHLAYGHQDFWERKEFGNVTVRIKTGFQYEEIKKSWIIGELAYRLCRKLQYTKPVFIDFNHHYTSNCDPDYFLSFDDGAIKESWNNEKPRPFLKQPGLVVREVSRQFSPANTLNLLEYAIRNEVQIKKFQKTIAYNQNYCQWKIKTIDTIKVKAVAARSISQTVKDVLSTKVYKEQDKNENISYYFQYNRYHIFYNEYAAKDIVALTVDNIYQFKNITYFETVVFDTDSSFYHIRCDNAPHASGKKVIEQTNNNFQPFDINRIGAYKIAFSFWYYHNREGERQPAERNVLYRIDREELIQDLDRRINH